MTPVVVTAAASADIARAYQFYEAKREGLGAEFIERVDEAISKIARNPLGHDKLIDDARRVNLRQFPYGVWYKVEDDGSIVIACLHHKRDGRLARERVRSVLQIPPSDPEPG